MSGSLPEGERRLDRREVENALSPRERKMRADYHASQAHTRAYTDVAVYVRVSTAQQKFESLETQAEDGCAIADRMGKKVYKIYKEHGVSGKHVDRPVFKQMMAEGLSGRFGGVVATTFSRISRDLQDGVEWFAELDEAGIDVFDGDVKQDKYSAAQGASHADKNHRDLLKFCHGGRKKAADKGKIPHPPAYAYTTTPGEPGKHKRDPQTEKAVEFIFHQLDKKVGSTTIVAFLNKDGKYPSPKKVKLLRAAEKASRDGNVELALHLEREAEKKVWVETSVLYIGQNPIYRGLIVYGKTKSVKKRGQKTTIRPSDRGDLAGSINESLRIVSDDLFARVQDLLNNKITRKKIDKTRGTYLGSGLVCCGRCAGKMGVVPSDAGYHYYRCDNFDRATKSKCLGSSTVLVEELDDFLVSAFDAGLSSIEKSINFKETYSAFLEQLTEENNRSIAETEQRYNDAVCKSRFYTEEKRLAGSTANLESIQKSLDDARQDEAEAAQALTAAQENKPSDLSLRLDHFDIVHAKFKSLVEQSADGVDAGQFKMAIRDFTHEIVVVSDCSSSVDLTIKMKIPDLGFAAKASTTFGTCEPLKPFEFVRRIDVASRKAQRWITVKAERRTALHQISAENPYRISDVAYELVAPLCAKVNLEVSGRNLALRDVLNALVFAAKMKLWFKSLPPIFGSATDLDKVCKRLIYAGAWDNVVDTLFRESPADTFNMARRVLAFPSKKRTKAALERLGDEPTAKDLRAAISKDNEAAANLRLLAVARHKEGEMGTLITKSLGISYSAFKNWISACRTLGIVGLTKRRDRSWLGEHEIEILQNARVTGIDPRDGLKKDISLTDLKDICHDMFGIEFKDRKSVFSALDRHQRKKLNRADATSADMSKSQLENF